MKNNVFTILFLILFLDISAQKKGQALIDSLLSLLETDMPDTNKVGHLNALAWEYGSRNPDNALKFSNEALQLAEKINWRKGVAAAYHYAGWANYNKGRYSVSIDFYQKALNIWDSLLLGAYPGEINKADQKTAINIKKASTLGNTGISYTEKGDYVKALEYHFKALKLDEESENKNGIARHNGNIGYVLWNQGDYPKALDYSFKSLKVTQELKNKTGTATTLNRIGLIYWNQGDHAKALDHFFNSLRIDEELDNKSGLAQTLGNIGNVYLDQKDHQKALDYYLKALKIAEEAGNKNGMALHLGNIGIVYNRQGDRDKALEYYFKALKIDQELEKRNGVARHLRNIGGVFGDKKEYDNSLKYYFQALKIDEELKNKKGKAISLGNIGWTYTDMEDYTNAEKYLIDGINLAKEIGELNFERLYRTKLSQLYQKKGEFEKALVQFKIYHTLKDSLFTLEKNKEITRKEMNYEFEKKEALLQAEKDKKDKEIILLNKENEIKALKVKQQQSQLLTYSLEGIKKQNEITLLNQNNEIQTLQLTQAQKDINQRDLEAKVKANEIEVIKKEQELKGQQLRTQKILRNGLILVAALLIVIGLVVINRIQLRKKLEKQQAIIDERRRISGDMHDDLGSNLSQISLVSQVLKRQVTDAKEKEELEKISSSAQGALEKMSEIVWTLNPKNDKLVNLLAYIRKYAMEYFEPTAIECKINIPGEIADVELSGEQRRNIFLTVKESLHNVVKHSSATKVDITFNHEKGNPELVIHDNGKGIDNGSWGKRKDGTFGNGLDSMKQRMEQIKGKFKIENNNGTWIRLEIAEK